MNLALLLKDADRLVLDYRRRKEPDHLLTLEMRQAWADEAVKVLQALIEEAGPIAEETRICNRTDLAVEWNRQFEAGERLVSVKNTLSRQRYMKSKQEFAKLLPTGRGIYQQSLDQAALREQDDATRAQKEAPRVDGAG